MRSRGNYLLLLTDVRLKNLTGRISIEIACGLILVRMGSATMCWWGHLSQDLSHLTRPHIWWVFANSCRAICPIPALRNSPKLLLLERSAPACPPSRSSATVCLTPRICDLVGQLPGSLPAPHLVCCSCVPPKFKPEFPQIYAKYPSKFNPKASQT